MFARPGQSQGLLYKHCCNSLPDSVSKSPFVLPTALWRRQAQTVRNNASGQKIDYVAQVLGILNLKGDQSLIITVLNNYGVLPLSLTVRTKRRVTKNM